jgi:hypothetical protein
MPAPRFDRSSRAVRPLMIGLPVLFIAGALFALWHVEARSEQTKNFGDDHEYLTMTMSLSLHRSPDYQAGDAFHLLNGLPLHWRNALLHRVFSDKPPLGYYRATDGRFYSDHFFTYSALVAPLRAWFDARPDAFHAHQIVNTLALSCALLSLLILRGQRVFWVIAPLAFFSPVLWFVPYAHPEAFVYSCGIVAMSCYLRGWLLPAIALMAVAATQYQPLAPLALCLGAQLVWNELRGVRASEQSSSEPSLVRSGSWLRGRVPMLIGALLASAIVFIPDAFYDWHYGSFSLIAREGFAQSKFLSWSKFAWLFVDPNSGMLAYAPGLLLWLLLAAALCVRRSLRERDGWGLALLACVLGGMFASTCQRNWNHPTFGVSRYVLYALAPACLFIGYELARWRVRASWLALPALLACGLQAIVLVEYGVFEYTGADSNHHSSFAQYVLEHWPALYSPPAETFCERTLARCPQDPETSLPLGRNYPVIYLDRQGIARKVLTANCDPGLVLGAWPWTPTQREHIQAKLKKCHAAGPLYLEP